MAHHIDYVLTYFPYKTPTLVRGEPTYNDLKRIKTELRSNASSVESNLGGGNHGHLFSALTNAEYLQIPGISAAAEIPSWPDPLAIPITTGAIQAIHLKERHQERIRVYREYQNVERALLNHLQRSLEPKYLDIYVNEVTTLLAGDILVILAHLFLRYSTVRGIDVKTLESEVFQTSFTPSDPLVVIWNRSKN